MEKLKPTSLLYRLLTSVFPIGVAAAAVFSGGSQNRELRPLPEEPTAFVLNSRKIYQIEAPLNSQHFATLENQEVSSLLTVKNTKSETSTQRESKFLMGLGASATLTSSYCENTDFSHIVDSVRQLSNQLKTDDGDLDPKILREKVTRVKNALGDHINTTYYNKITPHFAAVQFADSAQLTSSSTFSGLEVIQYNGTCEPLSIETLSAWCNNYTVRSQLLEIIHSVHDLDTYCSTEIQTPRETRIAQLDQAKALCERIALQMGQPNVKVINTQQSSLHSHFSPSLNFYSKHFQIHDLDIVGSVDGRTGNFSLGLGKGQFYGLNKYGLITGIDAHTSWRMSSSTLPRFQGLGARFFIGYGISI